MKNRKKTKDAKPRAYRVVMEFMAFGDKDAVSQFEDLYDTMERDHAKRVLDDPEYLQRARIVLGSLHRVVGDEAAAP